MKRVLTVATAFVLVGTCLWAGTASSQETTTIPDTTTTEAPVTTVAPTTEAPTTTVADTVPGAITPEQARTQIPHDILIFNWFWGSKESGEETSRQPPDARSPA